MLFLLMRNTAGFGTHSDELLAAIRSRLPSGWSATLKGTVGPGGNCILSVSAPDESTGAFIVQLKKALDPRDVPGAILRLDGRANGRPLLFAAPFLGPRTRQLLREAGASYADATGNTRLALERPGLLIEAQGSDKDPRSEPRPLRSLKGRTAGRVVRALCDFDPPYGVRELAQKDSTSLGSVARVVGLLDRESLVERDGAGRIERVRRPELVSRWTQDYGLQRSNEVMSCLAPRGLGAVLTGLRNLRGYSITGSLAASRRAASPPPRLGTVFAENPEALAKKLGVRATDAGANLLLLRPYDPVVFERTWSEEGLVFAALSQVAADLLTSPGRAPSEGEELLRWMGKHVNGWRA
jgi:hypothetical protein